MLAKPVIAIFDIGKTNKKLFLFDEEYAIVYERSARFEERVDEDGFPCEDLQQLEQWINFSLEEVYAFSAFEVKAVNFSAYGASFVYIGEEGKPVAPLYNYLKPYPQELRDQFYDTYGGEEAFSLCTASPLLGSLNSGMQLYRIKYKKPQLFRKIKYALHLPQYLSFLLSGYVHNDLTSIGCHTNLWDFKKGDYHQWVYREGIAEKLPPVTPSDNVEKALSGDKAVGIGMHDSSAALIPYLTAFREPFVLISTGTWCISLNPFNHSSLTREELQKDCLCYFTYKGAPVKAARLFAGNHHEEAVSTIAAHFKLSAEWYQAISFDPELANNLQKRQLTPLVNKLLFVHRDWHCFDSATEAYYQLMIDLVSSQVASLDLVLKSSPVKQIFVDGGFSKNELYMHLLAAAYPEMKVSAASIAQSTALGAALAIHSHWNKNELPQHLIQHRQYQPDLFSFTL